MRWARCVDEAGLSAATGSEGGVVIRDEEHELGARITLERLGDPALFAITCGIYGWMMHARYLRDFDAAEHAFQAMKVALDGIIEMIPARSDVDVDDKCERVGEALSAFVEAYP